MFLFTCSPPQVPGPRHENHDPESPLPHAVKSEIAQLTSKFTIDYANEGGDSCEQSALVCSISELVFYYTAENVSFLLFLSVLNSAVSTRLARRI